MRFLESLEIFRMTIPSPALSPSSSDGVLPLCLQSAGSTMECIHTNKDILFLNNVSKCAE